MTRPPLWGYREHMGWQLYLGSRWWAIFGGLDTYVWARLGYISFTIMKPKYN